MIAIATKLCRACNVVKPRTDFYVSEKRPSGNHKLMAKCKACQRKVAADRKRKGNGEYRTQAEVQAQAKWKCECGRAMPWKRSKCYDCLPIVERTRLDDWGRLCARETTKLGSERRDPWKNRLTSAASCLKRRNPTPYCRSAYPMLTCDWRSISCKTLLSTKHRRLRDN